MSAGGAELGDPMVRGDQASIEFPPENFCAICETETWQGGAVGSYRDPFGAGVVDGLPFRECLECGDRRLTDKGWDMVLEARASSERRTHAAVS